MVKIKEFFLSLREKLRPVGQIIAKLLSPITAVIKKHNEILNPIFVLTVICLIVAAALSLTNSLTANRIERINLQNKNTEMAALIPAEKYEEMVVLWEVADPHLSLYKAKNGEEIAGYIVTSSARGYGGEIVVMTAFNPDKSVKAISILNADNETPGLGQNITRQDFLSRFITLNSAATVVKDKADVAAGEIEAWTGATISSKGTVTAVNSAREYLETYLKLRRFENDNSSTAVEVTADNNGGVADEK